MDKSELRINERRAKHGEKVRQKHIDTVGVTSEDFYNFILKKIVAKDYDWMRGEGRTKMKRLKVDSELRKQASEKAKKLGFSSINKMVERILKREYFDYLSEPEKAHEMFESVGKEERNETHRKYKDNRKTALGKHFEKQEEIKIEKAKKHNMDFEGAFEDE